MCYVPYPFSMRYTEKTRYRTPAYLTARSQAFARFKGRCVSCGEPADEAHHYSKHYPDVNTETVDDLVPLCVLCHEFATFLRKHIANGRGLIDLLDRRERGIFKMQYAVRIEGTSDLIVHSGEGIDPEHPCNIEVSKLTQKPASKRTPEEHRRIEQLELTKALWLDKDGNPEIPRRVIRSCIEGAARKLKDGPRVREGLIVTSTTFSWDHAIHGDGTDLDVFVQSLCFKVPVVIGTAGSFGRAPSSRRHGPSTLLLTWMLTSLTRPA